VPGKELYDELDSQQAWSKARRGVAVQKVVCAIRDCPLDLIPFEEARKMLHLNQKVCLGLQEIELEKIRGSVGRYQDFTSAFLPRRENLSLRWQQVRKAGLERGLPPVELYKMGEAYFVLDGNHRVSIARTEGRETIDAYVCEYIGDHELSEEGDLDAAMCALEYTQFLQRSKLRPEQGIVFTVPGRYMEVESQIRSVQETLGNAHGEPVSFEEAAHLWYQKIYSPTVKEIRESRVLELFPQRTEADLFIWMWRNEPELRKKFEIPDTINNRKNS
jgi:hypothetical protein